MVPKTTNIRFCYSYDVNSPLCIKLEHFLFLAMRTKVCVNAILYKAKLVATERIS